jgi:hypothetical protein
MVNAPLNVNPLVGRVTDELNNAWSYTVANCTRFVAGALAWIPAGLGNANQWLANAQAKGLPTIGPTSSPPVGSVAVWDTGNFGHVAEVTGLVAGGFTVAEENFKGLGVTDVRNVTGSALQGLKGFILPPGVLGAVEGAATGVLGVTTAQAVAGLPVSVGHGLAGALTAGVHDIGAWFRNWLPALIVALVVAYMLFGSGGDRQ